MRLTSFSRSYTPAPGALPLSSPTVLASLPFLFHRFTDSCQQQQIHLPHVEIHTYDLYRRTGSEAHGDPRLWAEQPQSVLVILVIVVQQPQRAETLNI